MPLNCRSLIVTSGQVLGGVQHYGCFSRNSCSYHWFTSVFSPSLRRRMWRDEIKAYQIDKSIKLVALLWHEALKPRNLFLCVQERAHFFFPCGLSETVSLCWTEGGESPKSAWKKKKRLETCCYRKQMITLNASWASTLNCSCDSAVGKEGGQGGGGERGRERGVRGVRDWSGKSSSFRRDQEQQHQQQDLFEQPLILTATRKQTSACGSTSGFPAWPERWGKAMNQPMRSFSAILLGRAHLVSPTLIQPHKRENSCTGKRWLHNTQDTPRATTGFHHVLCLPVLLNIFLFCTLAAEVHMLLFNKLLLNKVLDYTPHW